MKNEMKERKRIEWLDTARSAAILLVVLCHMTETTYFYSDIDINSCSLSSKIFAYVMFTAGRMGVPFFLFISGYLLVPREYDEKKCIRFWKHNFLPLFAVTELWMAIYFIFLKVFNGSSIHLLNLICYLLFLKPIGMPNMWYLPMLLGLYLCLPFVAMAVQKIKIHTLIFPLICVCFFSFAVPTANIILNAFGRSSFSSQMIIGFGGGSYGFYLLCGYLFTKFKITKITKIYAFALFVVMFSITVWMQVRLLSIGSTYTVWYDCLPLAAASAALFSIFSGSGIKKWLKPAVNSLAVSSFGIFLVHKPVHYVLLRYLPLTDTAAYFRVIILFLLTLIISWIMVSIISRIPVIGRKIFLIKNK